MGPLLNPLALPGLLAMALAWGTAATILRYATGTGRDATRRRRLLALLILLEGTAVGCVEGVQLLMPTPEGAYAVKGLGVACWLPLLFLYPLFLGSLDTPLTAPLRGRAARTALAAGALLAPLLWVFAPGRFVQEMGLRGDGSWYAANAAWSEYGFWLSGAGLLLALAATLSAYLRAPPGTQARRQASSFVLAFAARDLLWAAYFIVLHRLREGSAALERVGPALAPFITILFVVMVGYGILRMQIFDIHLRIKRSLARTLVGTFYLAAFLVAANVAASFLTEQLGWAAGGAAVGLLLLVIRPVEETAEKAADLMMPRVGTGEDYLLAEKRRVYQAMYEEAVSAGPLSAKAVRELASCRERLGLSPRDAAPVEMRVLSLYARGSRPARRA